jgi:hypothetical protein
MFKEHLYIFTQISFIDIESLGNLDEARLCELNTTDVNDVTRQVSPSTLTLPNVLSLKQFSARPKNEQYYGSITYLIICK